MLNHGQMTNEYTYEHMKNDLMADCVNDIKSLERRLPVIILYIYIYLERFIYFLNSISNKFEMYGYLENKLKLEKILFLLLS